MYTFLFLFSFIYRERLDNYAVDEMQQHWRILNINTDKNFHFIFINSLIYLF